MALPRWFSATALLLVIVGGALGVAARALIVVPFSVGAHPLVVPGLTLAINVLGSFLLGAVVGAFGDRRPRLRAFLGTGVLGGFTTYSAFAAHVVTTSTAAPVVGMALAAVSVFGGVVAAALGLSVGRRAAGIPDAPETDLSTPPEAAE